MARILGIWQRNTDTRNRTGAMRRHKRTAGLFPTSKFSSGIPSHKEGVYPKIKASAKVANPQPRVADARVQSVEALLGEPVAVTMVPLVVLVGVDDDLEKT